MVSQVSELEALLDVDPNNKDFIALGDMNLCGLKWDNQNYEYKDLANKLKDFMNEEDCFQAVNDYTRIRSVGDTIQRSCLDHVIVNCASKVYKPVIRITSWSVLLNPLRRSEGLIGKKKKEK